MTLLFHETASEREIFMSKCLNNSIEYPSNTISNHVSVGTLHIDRPEQIMIPAVLFF